MNRIWYKEVDVIVVGFGGAGGCAAIEAHNYGSKTIILEKQPEATHYSNTRMSGGGFHSPNPSGKRKALKDYAKAMFSGENLKWKLEGEQPDYSDKIAELWAEYAPHNIEYMQNLDPKFKVVFSRGASFPEFPGAKESGYAIYSSTYSGKVSKQYDNNYDAVELPKEKQEHGEAFHLCILEGLNKRNIEIHYATRVVALIADDNEKIIGVKAKKDNKIFNYKAHKGVILASGGYEYNIRMRRSFLEGPGVKGWAFYGSTENTGDGIEMALKVGAGLSKIGNSAARLITSVPIKKHGLKIGLMIPAIGKPNEIVVDNYGNRYADERKITLDPSRYHFYKDVVQFDTNKLNYPRIPSWMIFDEKLRVSGPITRLRLARINSIPWNYDNTSAIKRGWILKSSSIKSLAIQIKNHPENLGLMDEKILKESVKKFNDYCKNGKDIDFGRIESSLGAINTAPFYALPLYAGGPNTKGGILTNANRQVLNWAGKPIEGLYCAGEISSIFQFVYQAGGNLAECIVSGRIAGKMAAQC